jgi:hypothetical protein
MSNWLTSGRGKNKRLARNFTHVPAQKRLDETLPTFHNQIENALQVDSVEAIVFKKSEIGRPCTCKKLPVTENLDAINGSNLPPNIEPQDSESGGILMDFGEDDIFGDHGQQTVQTGRNQSDAQREQQLREQEAGDLVDDEGSMDMVDDGSSAILGFEDNLFASNSINCGICYMRGIQPAYEPLNHTMFTLTNYNIVNSQGYHVDFSEHPAKMKVQGDPAQAWMEFRINVPKYFKSIRFSVRDNLQLIKGAYLHPTAQPVDGVPNCSFKWFEENRGRTVSIFVRGEDFTHVMIFFENNANPLKVNISQENETLDYQRESTIGQITVIAPEKIGHIRNADVIVIPERRLSLKVTDAPRKTTARRQIIEWELTTRSVQRSEALRNIYLGYKVY